MNRVRQQDHIRVRPRIHPQRRPCKARMPKAPDRKHHTARLRKRAIDIPSIPTQVLALHRWVVRRQPWCRRPVSRRNRRAFSSIRSSELSRLMPRLLGSGHQFQRRLLHRKLARPSRQPVQQRLRKQRHIMRRREHARMSRNSAHPPRRRIIHRSPQQPIVIRIARRISLPLIIMCRRRNPRQQGSAPVALRARKPHVVPSAQVPTQSPRHTRDAARKPWPAEDTASPSSPAA